MTRSQGATTTHLPGGSYPTTGITHLHAHLQGMRRQGRSDRTIVHRRREVFLLAQWLGHDPATATLDELEAWQSARLEREPAPWGDPAAESRRLNQMRWETLILRPYFRDMHRRGFIASDPCALLEVPPEPHRPPRPAAQRDVDAALAGSPTPRVRSWLLLAMLGLRCIEISRLDGGAEGDFYEGDDGQWYVVVHGKGRTERHVGVPSWMWPDLAHLAEMNEGPCWTTRRGERVSAKLVSELSRRYLRRVGLKVGPHNFRHKIATDVLGQTQNLRLVQVLLGHLKLDSTTQYTQVLPAEVAAALERSPVPRALRPAA